MSARNLVWMWLVLAACREPTAPQADVRTAVAGEDRTFRVRGGPGLDAWAPSGQRFAIDKHWNELPLIEGYWEFEGGGERGSLSPYQRVTAFEWDPAARRDWTLGIDMNASVDFHVGPPMDMPDEVRRSADGPCGGVLVRTGTCLIDDYDRAWMSSLSCATRLVVTTTTLSADAHHAQALAALGGPPEARRDRFAHFYVTREGSVREVMPIHDRVTGLPACEHHEVLVVVERSLDGELGGNALDSLVGLAATGLDFIEVLHPKLVLEETAEGCLSADSERAIVLPAQGIDPAAFCRGMFARGHALAGCEAFREAAPSVVCGQDVPLDATEFSCHDPTFSDLTQLVGRTSLRRVDVSGTSVQSLVPITWLPALEVLDVSRTPLMQLMPVRRSRLLREMVVDHIPAVSLWPLGHAPRLDRISARGTRVSDADLRILESRCQCKVAR